MKERNKTASGKTNNETDKLLSQIVAGIEIDWKSIPKHSKEEIRLIQQLKNIDTIQKVFNTKKDIYQPSQEQRKKVLFEWGHLQVLALLGEGSFGEVYRAYDSILNREVALKLLKPNRIATFHSKLFIDEARRIAQVRNRHVLAIHGAAVNDDRAGFWSDLIIGETLSKITNITHEELLKVGAAMASALQAVHEASLVHGDVKPANVMKDQNDQYILMDFGAGMESDSSNNVHNHSIGSPILMAPELYRNGTKTAATDMYALGCLMFKLASGRYLVDGKNVVDIVQAHKVRKYNNIHNLRPDLPKSMRNLIQSLVAYEASARPSADQLFKQIEYIRAEPRKRRKKRLIMGIITSLFLGFVLALIGLYMANESNQHAKREQQKAEAVSDFLQQMLGGVSQFGKGREVRVADILDWAGKNIDKKFKNQPHVLAAINESLGLSYQNLQINKKSFEYLNNSLKLKRKLYGNKHIITLKAMMQKAKVQYLLGIYQPAIKTYDTIIKQIKNKPQWHNMYQTVKVEKANILSEIGKFKEAEELIQQVLKTKPNLKQNNRNYHFLALMTLGENYEKQSDFSMALLTIEQAHKVLLKDANHKPTNELVILNTKGIILSNLKKSKEAEHNLRAFLALAKKYYGINNVAYLKGTINLSAELYNQKRFDEALTYQQQALSINKKLHGENNTTGVVLGINLANTYVAKGDIKKGENLMRKTLIAAKAVMGETNIDTLKLEYNLAELLNNTKKYQKAWSLANETKVKALKALGAQHLVTLLTEDNLAISLSGQEKHQLAVKIHLDLLRKMTQIFGKQSPYTQLVWSHAVNSLQSANKITKATELQHKLVSVLIAKYGDESPEVLSAKKRLEEIH